MNPFYFGSSSKKLYGVYHPPQAPKPRDSGVVLCAPFGQEYMRSHRAFRQLATLLTKDGHHVLRFDYFATGNSDGAGVEGSLEQWLEDIGVAADELRDTAAVSKISLVGLRLGASLAATVATRRIDLESVVTWDPVVDGSVYLSEMLEGASVPASSGNGGTDVVNVAGFPLTMPMRRGLGGLNLLELDLSGARNLFLVVSAEGPQFDLLLRHFESVGATAHYRFIQSPDNWDQVDDFGSTLLPHRLIKGIVESLSEART